MSIAFLDVSIEVKKGGYIQQMLGVSALHYSTGSQNSEGFGTVVSAHVLCPPTIMHPSIFIVSIQKFGS